MMIFRKHNFFFRADHTFFAIMFDFGRTVSNLQGGLQLNPSFFYGGIRL